MEEENTQLEMLPLKKENEAIESNVEANHLIVKSNYFQKVTLLFKIFLAFSDQVNDFIIFGTLHHKMNFGFAAVFFAVDLLPGDNY